MVKSPYREAGYRFICHFVFLSTSGFCFKAGLKSLATHKLKICFLSPPFKRGPSSLAGCKPYLLSSFPCFLPLFPPSLHLPSCQFLSSCSYLHVMMCQLCFKHKKKIRLEKICTGRENCLRKEKIKRSMCHVSQ